MKTWLNNLQLNDKSGRPGVKTQTIGCVAMVIAQIYSLSVLFSAYQNILPV
jgi:hypothetical protein